MMDQTRYDNIATKWICSKFKLRCWDCCRCKTFGGVVQLGRNSSFKTRWEFYQKQKTMVRVCMNGTQHTQLFGLLFSTCFDGSTYEQAARYKTFWHAVGSLALQNWVDVDSDGNGSGWEGHQILDFDLSRVWILSVFDRPCLVCIYFYITW